MITKLLLIGIGGGVGSVLRFGLAHGAHTFTGLGKPVGTLVVNFVGCLAIGFLAHLFGGSWNIREEYRLAILVGLLGGLTTFSTYAWDALTLADDGRRWQAIAYVLASNAICLVAVWIGWRMALRLA